MRVIVVPNGVDTNKFRPINRRKAVNWFEQKFCELDDDLNVIYVGRLSEEKGIIYLIKSLKYLDEGKLFLAGKGPQEKLLKKIAEKFDDRVIFLGKVRHDYIPLIHNAMDVFVLPSISMEGFSNSMLEALACGLPVVATPIGAAPEVIRPDMGIIVEPKNSRAIADGIRKVRNLNRKRIHNIVKSKYSFDVVAEIVFNLYHRVAGYPPESICFASLFAPPYELSGIGMQVFQLSKALVSVKKCKVTILCGLGGEGIFNGIKLIKVRCMNGLLSRPVYSITGILKINDIIKNKNYKFDIVDGRNWEGGLIAIMAKRYGSKAIMSLRGEGAIGDYLCKRSINKFIIQRVDCVTVTDSRTAKMAEELFI